MKYMYITLRGRLPELHESVMKKNIFFEKLIKKKKTCQTVNCLGWIECPCCGGSMINSPPRASFEKTATFACVAYGCENRYKEFVIDLPMVTLREKE